VLGKESTLSERYEKLLNPAARWVACEISRQECLGGAATGPPEDINDFLARLYNFWGVLYQASAPTFSPGQRDFFYDLAIGEFRRAIERNDGWYLPHENLADTYSFQGRDNKEEQRKALLEYEKALARVERLKNEHERELVRRRLTVGRATAMLLVSDTTLDATLIDRAATQIEDVQGWASREEAKIFPPPMGDNSDVSRFSYLLYNLACWHAVAHKVHAGRFPEAGAKARSYLARALARDVTRNLWSWADKDEDLVEIRDSRDKFLERLKQELVKELMLSPGLQTASVKEFNPMIERVLIRISSATPREPEPAPSWWQRFRSWVCG
jgi:hypothetical protein